LVNKRGWNVINKIRGRGKMVWRRKSIIALE
jgi:hypothetical protein